MTKLFFTTIAIILLAGCSHDDENDTQIPVMVLQEPKQGDIFKSGDEFHMQMSLSDNENLKECQIAIIPDSLAEDHKSTLHSGAWEVTKQFELSGKSFNIDEHLVVPDSADNEKIKHGRYIYRVNCIDAAGNVATEEVKFFLDE